MAPQLSEARKKYLKYRRAKAKSRLVKCKVVNFTRADWYATLKEFGYSCAYCGRDRGPRGGYIRLTRDHIMPLHRGGDHTRSNIVPACRSCNSSKGALTLEEWFGQAKAEAEVRDTGHPRIQRGPAAGLHTAQAERGTRAA